MEAKETTSRFDDAVSAALRAAASERRVTQTTISQVTGIPPRTLARYMLGERSIPIGKLVDVCATIGVGAGDIIDAAKVIALRAEKNTRR